MGDLMITSPATLNATDMFATVTLLGLVGVGLVYIVMAIERRVLHGSAETREGG